MLTDRKITTTKPRERPYKLADGAGMQIIESHHLPAAAAIAE
jgi:hypothetical protein